jgi:hypothetical protein
MDTQSWLPKVHVLATNTCLLCVCTVKKHTSTYEVLPMSSFVHEPVLCSIFRENLGKGSTVYLVVLFRQYENNFLPPNQLSVPSTD